MLVAKLLLINKEDNTGRKILVKSFKEANDSTIEEYSYNIKHVGIQRLEAGLPSGLDAVTH
jgi:hypothetical protein